MSIINLLKTSLTLFSILGNIPSEDNITLFGHSVSFVLTCTIFFFKISDLVALIRRFDDCVRTCEIPFTKRDDMRDSIIVGDDISDPWSHQWTWRKGIFVGLTDFIWSYRLCRFLQRIEDRLVKCHSSFKVFYLPFADLYLRKRWAKSIWIRKNCDDGLVCGRALLSSDFWEEFYFSILSTWRSTWNESDNNHHMLFNIGRL